MRWPVEMASSTNAGTPDPRYATAGDLLDIVRDYQRLAKEDTYRFPIPKDVTGVNIMKATLIRLNDYESKNRGQYSDIVQFNKASALERLREYDQAAALYRKVAETDGRLGGDRPDRCAVIAVGRELATGGAQDVRPGTRGAALGHAETVTDVSFRANARWPSVLVNVCRPTHVGTQPLTPPVGTGRCRCATT